MDIFLVWFAKKDGSTPPQLADDLATYYRQQIQFDLNTFVFQNGRIGCILLSDKGFAENHRFFQRDNNTVCFLVGKPTGLDVLFETHPVPSHPSNDLLKLKHLFEQQGDELIKTISPPFIFGFIEPDAFQIVHDGLGFEQGFVYEDATYWVCSNRCRPITEFVGNGFHVDDTAWKHYFRAGHFPLDQTPFSEISVLKRGAVWRCVEGRMESRTIDCFSDWLTPLEGSTEQVLADARHSFNDAVREISETYFDGPALADLSGGRDTRAILSSLLHQGLDCVFQTVGDANSADVHISKLLQQHYHLDVRFADPTLNQADPDQLRAKIDHFIAWQDGFGEIKSCKYFGDASDCASSGPILSGLMGTEIHRARYDHHALEKSFRKWARAVFKRFAPTAAEIQPPTDIAVNVRNRIFDRGKGYGLDGYSLFDYYNLAEKARRWGSAAAATPYDGYCLPFLNIGLIRATFSLSPDDRQTQLLHRHITTENMADMGDIPFDTGLVAVNRALTATPYDENRFWRTPTGKALMEMFFEPDHYMWHRLLNRNAVRSIWHDHGERKANRGDLFWRMAGFYVWCHQFRSHLNLT